MVRPSTLEHIELQGLRGRAAAFVERAGFARFITVLILINAVTLGLETYPAIMASWAGPVLLTFDKIVLAIFTLEVALKLYAYRLSFFKSGWNVFDFIIVAISLMPAAGPFAVLRALRILRVLRLLSVVPQMRRVISALFTAIPGMSSVVAVLFLVFYVSAVLCTKIFGAHEAPIMQEKFGTITASMYSLFQIMTLEGWSEAIVRPTMDYFPWSWMFFIPFIILTAFAVLNLFIGIIVDSMQRANTLPEGQDADDIKEKISANKTAIETEIASLRTDLAEIKELLKNK